jgi:hypothetical protein
MQHQWCHQAPCSEAYYRTMAEPTRIAAAIGKLNNSGHTRRQKTTLRRLLRGELVYLGATLVLGLVNWPAVLMVFVFR